MKNTFSDLNEVTIPRTFKECYKNNSLTNNLWAWAKGLEKAGIILACVMGGLAFLLGITLINNTHGGSILLSLFGAPIIAFLQYLSFHTLALLIGSKASVVQHTRITAKLALYEYSKKHAEEVIETKPKSQVIKVTTNHNTKKDNEEILENNITVNCPHCNKPVELNEDVIKPYCPNCKKYFDI